MKFTLECEQEDDGRWIAEVPKVPGALAYGDTANAAMAKAEAIALRALAEQIELQEKAPFALSFSLAPA